jgi:hypothetical protein
VKQTQTIQGRSVSAEEIQWLAQWIGEHPQWSRKQIARELCLRWDWRDERGRLKDFAARSFLLKLEARSQLTLPPVRIEYRRQRRAPSQPSNWREPSPWQASLEQLGPLSIERVTSASKSAAQWAFLLDRSLLKRLASAAPVIALPIGVGLDKVADALARIVFTKFKPQPRTSISTL